MLNSPRTEAQIAQATSNDAGGKGFVKAKVVDE
jgi:hypothetical protein